MNLLDTRPPFAGINGEIPPEFKTLSTPCYLMDEAVLQHNAEVLGALQKRTGCMSCVNICFSPNARVR